MKTKHYISIAILAIVAVFQMNTLQLMSQTFSLSSGTFVNSGRISIKHDLGTFRTNASASFANASGTISFDGTSNSFTDIAGSPTTTDALGSSAAKRIDGWMYYALSTTLTTASTQAVQPRWYTNLGISSTQTKQDFVSGVYVSGTYTPSTTGVANRTYSGTFFYDATSDKQWLTGGESYAAINLQNGAGSGVYPKVVASGVSVAAATFTVEPSQKSNIEIDGTLTINASGSASISAGAGKFIIGANASGSFVATAGSSSTFANDWTYIKDGYFKTNGSTPSTNIYMASSNSFELGNSGSYSLEAGNNTYVYGTFTNSKPALDNLYAAVGSKFDFESSTGTNMYLQSTSASNPYGNVVLGGFNSTFTPTGNVYTAGTMDMAGGNAGTGLTGLVVDMAANSGTFVILDPSKAVTYQGLDEVRGNFRLTQTKSAFVEVTSTYTLNNAASQVVFATGGAPTSSFTMMSKGGTFAAAAQAGFDVKRQVSLSYDGSPTWTIAAGYRQNETGLPLAQGGNAGWDVSYNEAMLRFYEGDNVPKIEKMATGKKYTRANSTATTWGSVKLSGFANTSTDVDSVGDAFFKSGNDLVFRSGPSVFTTIAPGRWSNPATWDEGAEPSTIDQVLIKHTVWAGFKRPIDAMFATAEATPDSLASNITIDNNVANASLMLGQEGSTAIRYGTNSNAIPGLTNNGNVTVGTLAATTPSILTDYTTDLTTSSVKYDGFYILSPKVTFVSRRNFTVNGYVGNNGLIDFGK